MSPTPALAPGVHLAGGPGWATGVVTETSTPSPNPSDGQLRPDLDPSDVSPGLLGFLAIFLVALATILLVLALTRQLRRMRHNADVRGIGPDGPLQRPAPVAGPTLDAAAASGADTAPDAAPTPGASADQGGDAASGTGPDKG